MSYTCDDCCLKCYERSRQYICTSFKPGKLPKEEARRIREGRDNGKKDEDKKKVRSMR